MKEVAIIVVTYNRVDLLKEVIESLRNQTYCSSQIIVINNGSTDNTLSWLEQQDDIITITQDNLGGAGGFFTGMKYAAENGYKYCWVMDDDVICEPDALEELYKAYNLKENIGFVCSKVVGGDGCPMNTPNVDERPTKNGYSEYYDMIKYQMIKVRRATFVSVFLSTHIISELGLPYKEYFIWGDDSEYTMRISTRYESYLVCTSSVIHKRSLQQSLTFENEINHNRIRMYFYYFRNTAHLQFKKMSFRTKVLHLFSLFCKSIKLLCKGNFYKTSILIRAIVSIPFFNPSIDYPQIKS